MRVAWPEPQGHQLETYADSLDYGIGPESRLRLGLSAVVSEEPRPAFAHKAKHRVGTYINLGLPRRRSMLAYRAFYLPVSCRGLHRTPSGIADDDRRAYSRPETIVMRALKTGPCILEI